MKVEIKRYRSGKQSGSIRKNVVEIDDYDVWNCDYTLAQIIHPLLVKFKESIDSYGKIDKEDVPQELHSTYDEHSYSREAFHWVLDEMIFAMQEIANHFENEPPYHTKTGTMEPSNSNEHGWVEMNFVRWESTPESRASNKAYHDRVQNGCRLFGLHFQNLWS